MPFYDNVDISELGDLVASYFQYWHTKGSVGIFCIHWFVKYNVMTYNFPDICKNQNDYRVIKNWFRGNLTSSLKKETWHIWMLPQTALLETHIVSDVVGGVTTSKSCWPVVQRKYQRSMQSRSKQFTPPWSCGLPLFGYVRPEAA